MPSRYLPDADADADAETFDRLFQEIYLRFHRRDGKRSGLTGASRAVLTHLSLTGPLSVGEAARHLDRAQSVVSEIVQQLEAKGLLERETDPQDRRRPRCTPRVIQSTIPGARARNGVSDVAPPEVPREQLEQETLAYLAAMPAWRDHPRVLASS